MRIKPYISNIDTAEPLLFQMLTKVNAQLDGDSIQLVCMFSRTRISSKEIRLKKINSEVLEMQILLYIYI